MLNRWFSLATRNKIARLMLLIGVFGPGIALGFTPSIWGATPLFSQMASLPIPLFIWGFFLILNGLVIIFLDKWRDVAYVCVALFYLATTVSGILVVRHALINHHPTSALILALPVLIWIYLEASLTATREQDTAEGNKVLLALENPEPTDKED